MTIEEIASKIEGVRAFRRPGFIDHRGSLRRLHSRKEYSELDFAHEFVEEYVSESKAGVLRGLHYDRGMGKFVQVIRGELFDVVVDLRPGSPTYAQWQGFTMSADRCDQLFIPAGLAHGVYALTNETMLHSMQTADHDPATEGQLRWDDPTVAIVWPFSGPPILSAKDAAAPLLHELTV